MRESPNDFQPFDGPQGPLLQSLWDTLHDVTDVLWPGRTRELTSTVVRKVLPLVQHQYSHHAAADAFAGLLRRFSKAGAARLKSLALMCSLACCASSIFPHTLPMAVTFTIPDDIFANAMRHCLGLSQMPLGAPVVACDCS
jgi:hypothetical protein